jgi:dCMP deaminase
MIYSNLKTHMNMAYELAKRSKAKRLQVGAIILKDGRSICDGYNGTPSGYDNICETEDKDGNLTTRKELCHAEMNAIAFAASEGISVKGCIIVQTHSPCFECAKLIIQSKIKEVYYQEEYRDQSGLEFLRENNIIVRRCDEEA